MKRFLRNGKTMMIALALCLVLLLGCISAANADGSKVKLNIWSFTPELQQMIEKYYAPDHPDVEFEFSMYPTEDYVYAMEDIFQSDATSADAPDVFTLEAAFVKKYVESGVTGDLKKIGFTDEELSAAFPVMAEIGQDSKGIQKGLSWQSTPGVLFYRADLAEKYLGVKTPEEFQAKVSDWEGFLNTAEELINNSEGVCKMVTGSGDIWNAYQFQRDQGWVVDNQLVIDQKLLDFEEMCKTMEKDDLTRNAGSWGETWFAGMRGEVETMCYFLPTWGLHYTLKPNCVEGGYDALDDEELEALSNKNGGTFGDWRMTDGPVSYSWGGTWVGYNAEKDANADAAKKEAIHDLIRFFTLNDDFLVEYARDTGDFVGSRTAVEKILADGGTPNPFLGGQDHYAAFASAAATANGSLMSEYDNELNSMWDDYVTGPYINGEKDLLSCVEDFKQSVAASFSELKIGEGNGLIESDGKWYLYRDGEIQTQYNGLYNDANVGWWLIKDGMIDFSYNALYEDPALGWWKINGGTIDFGYNGLYCDPDRGWWLINGGTIDFGYNGLYNDENVGWWKIKEGHIDWDYSGLYEDANVGWWLIDHGCIAWDYVGLYNDANWGWWMINHGAIDRGFNGLYYYGAVDNWFLITDGYINWGYNGLYNDANVGWWKISGGMIDWGYSGLYEDASVGWWLIDHGSIAWDYVGLYNDANWGWWMINYGAIDRGFNGLYYYGAVDNWFLITNGYINWGYSGLYNDANVGWWKISGGMIDWGFTGEYEDATNGKCRINGGHVDEFIKAEAIADGLHLDDDDVWRLYLNGSFASGYSGLYNDSKVGWWKITGGLIDWGFTGEFEDATYGKCRINVGHVDEFIKAEAVADGLHLDDDDVWRLYLNGSFASGYSGLYNDSKVGWWVIRNGLIDWGYNGEIEYNGGVFQVINGGLVF